MTHDRSKSGLEELQRVLDAYGADRDRWPPAAEAEAEAQGALAGDRQAARMLAEARALDALLAHAPLPRPERRAALADRIVAAARTAEPGSGPRQPGIVIPWPGAARRSAAPAAAAGAARLQTPWRAAALLAASLALGVFIGALDLAPAPVSRLVETADIDSDLDRMASLLGSEGLISALDEDFL